jgi:hypothetical protein
MSRSSERDMKAVLAQIGADLPAPTMYRTILAWTQLFGLLSFELFSQTRGLVSDHAATFDDATRTTADAIGLP